eukprot:TRINITY_DN48565_c0_g1_i1.p1 TRINITY_DN48565_c0_g1~~TRINITY_DN48565_c0_g1_i1.p1  ORF type:complete len:277 (-),score=64.28 TRINITY_DN48565_c0_g1_i1:313-1068(-)
MKRVAKPSRRKAAVAKKLKLKATGPSTKDKRPAKGAPWFTVFTGANNLEYQRYMREEWGWEKRGENPLFEKLCLEGQQAGLSWATVLAKRQAYRKAFHRFNVKKVARMTDGDVKKVMQAAKRGPGGKDAVICHIGKLLSIPQNARQVLALRSSPYIDPKTGSAHKDLDGLLWSFVGGKPILNKHKNFKAMPTKTATAEAMSKALRKLGFNFCGPTICYSLMQSCGLVIDHPKGTPEYKAAVQRLSKRKARR